MKIKSTLIKALAAVGVCAISAISLAACTAWESYPIDEEMTKNLVQHSVVAALSSKIDISQSRLEGILKQNATNFSEELQERMANLKTYFYAPKYYNANADVVFRASKGMTVASMANVRASIELNLRGTNGKSLSYYSDLVYSEPVNNLPVLHASDYIAYGNSYTENDYYIQEVEGDRAYVYTATENVSTNNYDHTRNSYDVNTEKFYTIYANVLNRYYSHFDLYDYATEVSTMGQEVMDASTVVRIIGRVDGASAIQFIKELALFTDIAGVDYTKQLYDGDNLNDVFTPQAGDLIFMAYFDADKDYLRPTRLEFDFNDTLPNTRNDGSDRFDPELIINYYPLSEDDAFSCYHPSVQEAKRQQEYEQSLQENGIE